MSSILDSRNKPTKEEQELALKAKPIFLDVLGRIESATPVIEIMGTEEKIRLPITALQLLAEILEAIGEGKPVSIVPRATELTTQAVAEYLGCSRPHVVKLLENGEIPFTKVGKHRRVKFEDVLSYKNKAKAVQKAALIEIMRADEEIGLYDT